MRWLSGGIGLVSIAIALTGLSTEAQQSAVAARGMSRASQLESSRQWLLSSALHQRVVSAGGKLMETRGANTADLSTDLASLSARSDEVLLVHVLTCHGGISASGTAVNSYYDVQVLRSWKGPQNPGAIVRVFVPAGGFLFPDGAQATSNIKAFSPLRRGGRYVLFLNSLTVSGQNAPSLWLAGDGVQGGFELLEEKVQPVYQGGPLWKTYTQQAVPVFLSNLDAIATGAAQ